ncbi:MAG: rod shape-determining protein RodA [Patescibacteria group bacterium]|nr:rod shape-determining protein RodA [Patescibacteria group bacterium]
MGTLRNFDWVLFVGLLVLAVASLVSLASSSIGFFWRQLVWYILGFIIILGASRLDWRRLISQPRFRYGLYWFSVLLLVLSNLQTGTVRGVKSWLQFGGLQFEPAELAKLALIIVLAGFFSRRYIAAWLGKNIALSLFYTLIPVVLVAIQPDFGSALVILGIWIGFLLISGINKKRLVLGLVVAVLVVTLLWMFFLKPYQKDRLTGFIFPESDPLGVNYNVIQSKIAIGSAGFWGKGFGEGTQTQLNFLPEAQTDFLFAAFIEEWGLFGGIFVVLTFLLIIFRMVGIGIKARNNDSKFIVLGVGLILVIHFFVNIGSNLGFLPVTGINFPFLSYGGSSILTISVLISIIEKIKLESSY